jgi:hypothetical protein
MKAKWTQKESELEQDVRKQAALFKQVCLALLSVLQLLESLFCTENWKFILGMCARWCEDGQVSDDARRMVEEPQANAYSEVEAAHATVLHVKASLMEQAESVGSVDKQVQWICNSLKYLSEFTSVWSIFGRSPKST